MTTINVPQILVTLIMAAKLSILSVMIPTLALLIPAVLKLDVHTLGEILMIITCVL